MSTTESLLAREDAASSASASEQVLTHLSERVLTSISPAADTAAIVLEPIQSDGGDIVPPDEFLPGLRRLCHRHGIWLVFDEVKTGLGRTGAMFGFQHSGVVPDAVLQSRHPLIGDVRGRGCRAGHRPQTRQPAATDAARLVYRCFELGLIVMYTGLHSSVIELTPPLILTEEDARRGLDILDRALTDIESGIFDDTKLAGYAGW